MAKAFAVRKCRPYKDMVLTGGNAGNSVLSAYHGRGKEVYEN